MANEITVRAGFQINQQTGGSLRYASQLQGFNRTMVGIGGPTPGMIYVPLGGIAIDLSALGTPGIAEFYNMDAQNYVTVGIRDPITKTFYPLLEIGPGESYPIPLSRSVRGEWLHTGTGTSGPIKQLWAEANGAPVKLIANVFER